MTSGRVVLQGPDGQDLTVSSVVAALGGTFGVTTGARRLVRRARLDTFDRRLLAAGLVLEHERGPSLERLVLERPRGSALTAPVADRLRWPALAGLLPAGAVRDTVAPVSGIRALMVHSRERRNRSPVELRNEDEKVVVRLELDEPAGAAATRSELRVHALRGYDNEARRALRLLTEQGLRPVEEPKEHGPGCQPAPDTAAATARLLLAQSLGEFLVAMRDTLPGLLGDVDTEFLHDFRVAVRRTRSTLKLGRAVLPGDFRHRWEPAFKWLGDLTTPVRDLDVYELGLPEMTSWLVAAAGADLEPFAAHLHRRRAAERRVLVRGLKSARFVRLVSEWEAALAELAQPAGDGPGEEHLSAGALGARSISRAYRRVARGGAAVSADSPAEDLHTLRKRAKELRYALEVFAPVLEPGPRKGAVSELKTLQDVLGRFQDSEVQRTALRGFAEEMVQQGTPAGAVLAMGELIGHLDADQARARQDFDGAFARFVRPSSQRRIHRLGGSR